MDDYKPKSNRYKEEQKKQQEQANEKRAEKVVTGTVITKKKSGLRKFADDFMAEDAKNIKNYVFGEVLIPAAKKAIYDIVTNTFDMILYGGSRPGNKHSTAGQVSYRNYYDRGNSAPRDNRSISNSYSYDDIILTDRREAQEVLDRMDEMMATYGLVRVADLFDLVGKSGSYTDNKYGWTSIRSAEIVRVRDGWWIKMPRAVPID